MSPPHTVCRLENNRNRVVILKFLPGSRRVVASRESLLTTRDSSCLLRGCLWEISTVALFSVSAWFSRTPSNGYRPDMMDVSPRLWIVHTLILYLIAVCDWCGIQTNSGGVNWHLDRNATARPIGANPGLGSSLISVRAVPLPPKNYYSQDLVFLHCRLVLLDRRPQSCSTNREPVQYRRYLY